MFADEKTREDYRQAWEAWQKQVEQLHRVFLEGERLRPDQLKALLTREARRKELYDEARLRLLGLDQDATTTSTADDNPFKT
jgi:hypothetical protein